MKKIIDLESFIAMKLIEPSKMEANNSNSIDTKQV